MLDAVVVGAGHNGLTAAAYLARAGLSVRVLERRDIVGGACVTEELWPGVRASPGAYTFSLLRPEIVRELELERHGLRVTTHEPGLFAPFPDGRSVVTWSSRERTHAGIARDWSKADADGYAAFSERWERAAQRARPLLSRAARPRALAGGRGGGHPRRQRGRRAGGDPVGARAGAVRGPGPDRHARRPRGSRHRLRRLLPRPRAGRWRAGRVGLRARRHGRRDRRPALGGRGRRRARVPATCPVERVLVSDDGRAEGVVTEAGEEVRARAVLLNCDPLASSRLAGVDPPAGWRQAGPVVKVMVLLDGLPDFPAWPGPEPWQGAIDIGFTLADLTAAADDARAGRPAAAPWIEAACQTATDDSLAPPGRHVLSMFCQCFPADTDAEAAADTAIARFAEVCPELPGRVVDRLALGPKELEARFGITGGHIFHGEMLPGQLLEQRPDRRRFGGMESLYLAGSGAHPGGAVTGAPGLLAARAVLEDLAGA